MTLHLVQQLSMESCFRASSAVGFDRPGVSSSQLASAMRSCALDECDADGPASMSRSQDLSQPLNSQSQKRVPSSGIKIPRRLALELASQPSQEMMGTQDFSTPVEQQFHFEHDPSNRMTTDDETSRSPAPSPDRKRPRQLGDNDSDSASQSQSFSQRSLGEPSTCSKHAAGMSGMGGSKRPPMAPVGRVHLPPVLRNPYLKPNGAEPHAYTDRTPRPDPKQSRFTWDYKMEAEIGHGKFGIVFRAVHRQQGKAYAVKRSRKPLLNIAEKNTWLAEIQALTAVEGHPNVITMYDSWSEHDPQGGEHMYIKTELCGENLAAVLKHANQQSAAISHANGTQKTATGLTDAMLHDVFRQMCAALKHVHGLGLAHLDLKPDNIYTTPSGLYKLGDFGLATAKNGAHSGALEGDTRYLAPELLRNNCDNLDKADMFALGVTMYELATGMEMPTGGTVYQDMRRGVLPKLCPGVNVKLQEVMKKLMLFDPKLRPSADDLCKSALVRTHSIPLMQTISTRGMGA